jgi:hypothetical protein
MSVPLLYPKILLQASYFPLLANIGDRIFIPTFPTADLPGVR